MNVSKLKDMKNGWFIGDFNPTLIRTRDVEVAIKKYQKGDYEERHYHKLATEITVIVSGRVKMNSIEYQSGDIVIIEPYESTDFEALERTVCSVVKLPGAIDDKYLGRVD
jgi:quercetin dioxygenase-like cupin family protein